MSIDDKIKQELEDESAVIDDLMKDQDGMMRMFGHSFRSGGLNRWLMLATVVILFIVTPAMIWSAWQFMTAGGVEDRLFWGVWFIITLNAQGALKLWGWMEANRNSVIREIKRVEVELARLRSGMDRAS